MITEVYGGDVAGQWQFAPGLTWRCGVTFALTPLFEIEAASGTTFHFILGSGGFEMAECDRESFALPVR
jgi:hypothetical protein